VSYCTSNPLKPLVCVGDFNSRTGSRSPHHQWMRFSPDSEVNTRGRWLLQMCNDHDMQILNGTEFDTHQPARYTSSQPQGSSIIDYVLYPAQTLHNTARPRLTVQEVPVWPPSLSSDLWGSVTILSLDGGCDEN